MSAGLPAPPEGHHRRAAAQHVSGVPPQHCTFNEAQRVKMQGSEQHPERHTRLRISVQRYYMVCWLECVGPGNRRKTRPDGRGLYTAMPVRIDPCVSLWK